MATKEDIAAEQALQERLELSVLAAFESLSVSDLQHWSLRSYAFKNLDQHISRACDDDRPQLERLFLLLTIFKCLNRLMEPPKAPVKREPSAVELLFKKQQAAKGNPKRRGKSSAEYYRIKLAKMSPEAREAYRAKERARVAARRAKARVVN